jgi:hypothetical protein
VVEDKVFLGSALDVQDKSIFADLLLSQLVVRRQEQSQESLGIILVSNILGWLQLRRDVLEELSVGTSVTLDVLVDQVDHKR